MFEQVSEESVVVCRHGEERHIARLQLDSLRQRNVRNENFYKQICFFFSISYLLVEVHSW